MKLMVSTTFIEEINQVPTANDDTQPCLVVRDYAVLMTVVESQNPYLNGRQVMTPMTATPFIAEAMFHKVLTDYEDMDGGHPFEKVGDWMYKGVFSGEAITLELCIAK